MTRHLRVLALSASLALFACAAPAAMQHAAVPSVSASPKPENWSDRSYYLPMRDGVRLALSLYFPGGVEPSTPRPVLLMQGGADVVISIASGERLFEAAGQPKELWFEPKVGHSGFDRALPGEYERRVVGFFDEYLEQ